MLEQFINQIHRADCIEMMKKLPEKSIDLIVTSPPYNLRNTTGGYLKSKKDSPQYPRMLIREGYDGYDDCMPHEEYVAWQRQCLSEMIRLLPDSGAIYYNHKWRVQGGLIQDRADIVEGFPVRQIIIWQQNGGFNYNPHYFVPSYEVIYLIAKPGFRLLKSSLTDVWNIPRERDNPHPAPFPIAIAERCIRASANVNVVLDPFMGSGSTAVAAIRAKKDWIGIDNSEKYCKLAKSRIELAQPSLL